MSLGAEEPLPVAIDINDSENRQKYGSQPESDLTRKALSTPAYLRTLIRYTPYLWKQIIDISTIMTTVEYWWLSDNRVHCLPICWVTTSSPIAMILWPFPPTVHIHRSMLKSNQYPLKQLRSGVVMGEFNSFTFLSNVTASATQQQLIATLNAVCIYIPSKLPIKFCSQFSDMEENYNCTQVAEVITYRYIYTCR